MTRITHATCLFLIGVTRETYCPSIGVIHGTLTI
jgi:hypothetical protein